MKIYENSLVEVLRSFFPDQQWLLWKFRRIPWELWGRKDDEEMVAWLENWFQIKEKGGWFQISRKELEKAVPRVPFDRIIGAIGTKYPDHNWEQDRLFDKKKNFIESLGKKMGIKELQDWNLVRLDDTAPFGGKGFIDQHF